jgi:hypothetical protein
MAAPQLPYDMGNAGDLLKHGLLAEFTQWFCSHQTEPLRFLDPFAGRPFGVAKPEVLRRLQALPPCALRDAQRDSQNYYGSANVVLNAAQAVGRLAHVSVSDQAPEARNLFLDPIEQLEVEGFTPTDGFSVLDSAAKGDLLLLDPFGDFLPRHAQDVIPKVAQMSAKMACVLFVLNMNPGNRVGHRYAELRRKHLPSAWSLHCPKLGNRSLQGNVVRGETRYEVEVLLAWSRLTDHPRRADLSVRLEAYAVALSSVLRADVSFSPGM